MSVKIKICGINSLEAAKVCISNKADFLGFVFVKKSPRYISDNAFQEISSVIDKKNIMKVGLFANPSLDDIKQTLRIADLDYIQLHGQETADIALKIKQAFNKPIIKAVAINQSQDLDNARPFYNIADIILFDAKPPKNSVISGGNGIAFDWNILKNRIPKEINWGLAGGLNPLNVKQAIKITNTKMVDVSSGVESSKGVKDSALIKKFIKEAKNDI